MFRAVPCVSSGGQIVLLQPLVSPLCKQPYSMQVEPNEKQTIPKKYVLVTKQYTYNIQTLQNDEPD